MYNLVTAASDDNKLFDYNYSMAFSHVTLIFFIL